MKLNSTRLNSTKLNKPSRADLAGRHAVALGLAIVSLAATERAAAECTVSNATVTCTGTTTNSPNGFGTGTETGITINVQPGASVSGDIGGLIFRDGTVNNAGTVSGGPAGPGDISIGIQGIVSANVINSGTISA